VYSTTQVHSSGVHHVQVGEKAHTSALAVSTVFRPAAVAGPRPQCLRHRRQQRQPRLLTRGSGRRVTRELDVAHTGWRARATGVDVDGALPVRRPGEDRAGKVQLLVLELRSDRQKQMLFRQLH